MEQPYESEFYLFVAKKFFRNCKIIFNLFQTYTHSLTHKFFLCDINAVNIKLHTAAKRRRKKVSKFVEMLLIYLFKDVENSLRNPEQHKSINKFRSLN